MKRMQKTISIISLVGLSLPILSATSLLSSCGNSTTTNKIDDSKTEKNVKITSQQNTETTFVFIDSSKTATTEYLTAVAQMDTTDAKIIVSPKVYVLIENNIISAKVSYSAENVTNINDSVKFHITFTNSDPNNTWAETVNDLSITYDNIYLDSSFEYSGYLFAGQDSTTITNTRKFSLFIAEPKITSKEQIKVEGKVSAGSGVVFKNISWDIVNDKQKLEISIPYESSSAAEKSISEIEFTISTTIDETTTTQKFNSVLLATKQLYLESYQSTMKNGGKFSWFYWYLVLPLGTKETVDDITVEITQTQTSTQPMYVQAYSKQLDASRNYFTVIFNIKDSYIDPSNVSEAKFNVKISKPDTRNTKNYTEVEGSAAWEQTFENLSTTFDKVDGEYFTIKDQTATEFVEVETGNDEYHYQNTFIPSQLKQMYSTDYNWAIEFNIDYNSLPEDLKSTTITRSQILNFGDIETDLSNIIQMSISVRKLLNMPAEWQTYLNNHMSVETKWDVVFTCTRKMNAGVSIEKYQKQSWTMKDYVWLKITKDA